jgi:hypothetical protein
MLPPQCITSWSLWGIDSTRFLRLAESSILMTHSFRTRVRPFHFFFLFVISLPEVKWDPFRLVFTSFHEKIKIKFCMFLLQTFFRIASFCFQFLCLASSFYVSLPVFMFCFQFLCFASSFYVLLPVFMFCFRLSSSA